MDNGNQTFTRVRYYADTRAELYRVAADSVHELLREALSTLATAEPGSPMHAEAAVSAGELDKLAGRLRACANGMHHDEAALLEAWQLCSAY